MKYLEFTFTLRPASSDFTDVLEMLLAEIGFDSFIKDTDAFWSERDLNEATGDTVLRADLMPQPSKQSTEESSLKAYIKTADFDAAQLDALLKDFPLPHVEITYEKAEAEDKDWNTEWEKHYFEPLCVDDECVIAATFHENVPKARYNITINPRMSFGTGHHETTSQMLHELLSSELEGKRVLDMGCGTGILAILASMRGAKECTAIDVDEWCVMNSKENCALNNIDNIEVRLGDASLLTEYAAKETAANDTKKPFDVVLANIHLNIILNDLPAYAGILAHGGLFLTSGFYAKDLPRVRSAAEDLEMDFLRASDRREWCCAVFRKK